MDEKFDLDMTWTMLFYEEDVDPEWQKIEDEKIQLYRYNHAHQILVVAAFNETEELLKLYRIEMRAQKMTLLHVQASDDWRLRWIYLELSPDGRIVAAAIRSGSENEGGGTKYMAWEENEMRYEEEEAVIPLRYDDHNITHQFFAVLHPNNQHAFQWMYAEQMLKVIHLPSGSVVKTKQLSSVYAMGISECGDQLLLSVQNGTWVSYSLPDLEAKLALDHYIGYDWWGPMGLGINREGDVAICFEGKDRTSYCDINHQVSDRDSHLVMWQRDSSGVWKTMDAFHFQKGAYDICADDGFVIKSIGSNIYFAGIVDDKRIFWMEFPSLRHQVIEAGLGYGDQIAFNEDASMVLCGDFLYGLRGYPVPVQVSAEPAAVMMLAYPVEEEILSFPMEDWRLRWDHATGCLDLTGSSIRDLHFLEELPDLVTLILDDSDVLDLPDLDGFPHLRKLGLNQCLIQDFQPLARLRQLEELTLRECAIPHVDWLDGMVSLRKVDLAFSSVLDIGPLASLMNLEWLSLEKTKINDISALRGLPIRHLDLTMSRVADLEPIHATHSLETLMANHIRISGFVPSTGWRELRQLSVQGASLDEKSLIGLPKLEWLDLSWTDLQDFSFLRKMKGLKGLALEYTAFSNLQDIAHLKELAYLNIRDTAPRTGLEFLVGMPLKDLRLFGKRFADLSPLGELAGLQRLDIVIDHFADFGPMVQRLTNLERLLIAGAGKEGCQGSIDFLRPLQKLKWLELSMGAVEDMAPLAELHALEHLHIWVSSIQKHCSLAPLQRLKSLRWSYRSQASHSVPDIFSGLAHLESFQTSMSAFQETGFLATFSNLRKLKLDMYLGTRLDFLQHTPKIQSLEFSNAMHCDSLNDLRHCPDLRHFSFGNSADPAPLFKMERLRTLALSFSNFPLKKLQRLTALRSLAIQGRSHQDLKELPLLPSLTSFGIYGFQGKTLDGLGHLPRLRNLSITNCKLDAFPDLQALRGLEVMELKDVTLKDAQGLGSLAHLQELTLDYPHFSSFDWLANLQALRDFRLNIVSHRSENGDAEHINGLFALRNLQYISMKTALVTEIPNWKFLQNVAYAWLEFPQLIHVAPLEKPLPLMRDLHWQSRQPIDFSFLAAFTGLRELDLSNPYFTDLRWLSGNKWLRDLDISRCGVKSLAPLKGLKHLQKLEFTDTKVHDLKVVEALPGLRDIRFEGVTVPSYAPLAKLKHLQWISGDLPTDKDVQYLGGKPGLKTIMLRKGKIATLEPLFPMIENNQLEHLSMLDTVVEELPKGLKFDRYDFIKLYNQFLAKKRKGKK